MAIALYAYNLRAYEKMLTETGKATVIHPIGAGKSTHHLVFDLFVPKDDEECIVCGKKTGINRKTPVAYRKYYVECCGQLCGECFESLFLAQKHGDGLYE